MEGQTGTRYIYTYILYIDVYSIHIIIIHNAANVSHDQAAMPKLQFLALDSTWDAMDILSNFNFQDHDLEVIYLEVKRNKCRFLTKWNHPLRPGEEVPFVSGKHQPFPVEFARSWSWSCEKIFEKALKDPWQVL